MGRHRAETHRRLPLLVFSSGQSYGLVWDMKRGFFISSIRVRPPSGRTDREMKARPTDIAIEKQRVPTERWERGGFVFFVPISEKAVSHSAVCLVLSTVESQGDKKWVYFLTDVKHW